MPNADRRRWCQPGSGLEGMLQTCASDVWWSRPRACGAVEVEEAAAGKVHKLLALAVVVQADLLRLCSASHSQAR